MPLRLNVRVRPIHTCQSGAHTCGRPGRWCGHIQELSDVPPVLPAVSAPHQFFLSLPPLCFPYQLTHLLSLPSFTLPFLQGRSLSVGFPSDGEGVDLPPRPLSSLGSSLRLPFPSPSSPRALFPSHLPPPQPFFIFLALFSPI